MNNMNKMIAILSFVVGYAVSDVSWAHTHIVAQEGQEGRSIMLAGLDEFIGPVLKVDDLSQRAKQPSWDWMSLAHIDPHHLFGNEPQHPVPYRNFQIPDGGALMFSWPLASFPTFKMNTQAAPTESRLNREN